MEKVGSGRATKGAGGSSPLPLFFSQDPTAHPDAYSIAAKTTSVSRPPQDQHRLLFFPSPLLLLSFAMAALANYFRRRLANASPRLVLPLLAFFPPSFPPPLLLFVPPDLQAHGRREIRYEEGTNGTVGKTFSPSPPFFSLPPSLFRARQLYLSKTEKQAERYYTSPFFSSAKYN